MATTIFKESEKNCNGVNLFKTLLIIDSIDGAREGS